MSGFGCISIAPARHITGKLGRCGKSKGWVRQANWLDKNIQLYFSVQSEYCYIVIVTKWLVSNGLYKARLPISSIVWMGFNAAHFNQHLFHFVIIKRIIITQQYIVWES